MQAVFIVSDQTPRKRRPKSKRISSVITYRLDPKVKLAISELASAFSRSENLQVEFGLKIAYLHCKGINIFGMTDLQIIEKFDEMTLHLNPNEDTEE
ncbi:hypothetical protein [Fischerella sp. PCC 9605]|uniref:hypothetical protein n=1 Tax=Fischerella sp. PCC 9605 TaxID=1173024 RepID=UPI00047E2ED6|nr:hypothetical protein [Fischerella sp. PCC 9605]